MEEENFSGYCVFTTIECCYNSGRKRWNSMRCWWSSLTASRRCSSFERCVGLCSPRKNANRRWRFSQASRFQRVWGKALRSAMSMGSQWVEWIASHGPRMGRRFGDHLSLGRGETGRLRGGFSHLLRGDETISKVLRFANAGNVEI